MWLHTAPAVAVLGAIVAFFTNDYVANRHIAPPSPKCTLFELSKKVPRPVRIAIVTRLGSERLVWVGPIPTLTIRSGPPCYIFDRNGILVDWCPETGEGWRSDDLKIAAFREKALSLDEAFHWCAEDGN
jgi:hypothetical protein